MKTKFRYNDDIAEHDRLEFGWFDSIGRGGGFVVIASARRTGWYAFCGVLHTWALSGLLHEGYDSKSCTFLPAYCMDWDITQLESIRKAWELHSLVCAMKFKYKAMSHIDSQSYTEVKVVLMCQCGRRNLVTGELQYWYSLTALDCKIRFAARGEQDISPTWKVCNVPMQSGTFIWSIWLK